MATLTGQTIAASYEQLLSLPNGGLSGTTLVAITDGDSDTASALKIATTSIAIGATHKLGFDGTNTGTYISESANDILDFYAGGTHMLSLDKTNTEVVVNEADAGIDFRVESNDVTSMLIVDASNNAVGIGASTVLGQLTVTSNTATTIDVTECPRISLYNDQDTELVDGDFLGRLTFGAREKSSSSTDRIGAYIAAIADNTWTTNVETSAARLQFHVEDVSGSYVIGTPAMTIDSGGNVGIGTASPDKTLEVESTAAQLRLSYNSTYFNDFQISSGGDLYILDKDGTNNLTVTDGGFVGVGTNSPDRRLHIEGQSGDASIGFSVGSTGTATYCLGLDNSDGDKFKIHSGNDIVDASDFTIDTSGNVGIGVAAPDGTLHVHTGTAGSITADITDLVVETNASGGISLLGANDGQVEIAFGDDGDANIGRIAYNHGGNYLATVVNASEVMRITSAGNVGIGTTTPDPSSAGWGNALTVAHTSTEPAIELWLNNASVADEARIGQINFMSGTTAKINAAIGAKQNGTAEAEAHLIFNTRDSGDTSGTPDERMRITSDGNVGIGTAAFASGVSCLGLINGTPPGGACTNTAGLYVYGGDLAGFADDGNATTLAAASCDERAKDNIAIIPNALSRLANVKGVTFNYVSFKDSTLPFKDKIPDSQEYAPYGMWGGAKRVGVIAQGVEVAYDGLDITNSVRDRPISEEGYDPELGKEQEVYGTSKQVDMETLIPLLIEAVKELSAKVTALENA